MAARLVLVAAAAAVLAGCGGGGEKRDQAARAPRQAPVLTGAGITGDGRLVDIGGRKLYLECVGSGSPTVLLEAGFASPSKAWVDVQETLGRVTHTCSYDRAGTGSSVGTPGVHDAGD
jgi:hypothetical protein